MRVAIVGGGLAGLACAHELERLAILPVIFERQPAVGKPSPAMETMAQFLHSNPRQDIFDHIRQDLGLPLNPHNAVHTMVLHSQQEEATIRGRLGYTTVRGHDDRSLERQLLRRLAAEVRYGTRPDLWELRQEYDWVVVANGTHEWSQVFARWTPHITWSVRGARVMGSFDPAELHFFIDTRYAGTGYAMISPVDEVSAIAGVGVPGADSGEAEQHWQAFQEGAGHFWDREVERVRVDELEIGYPSAVSIGNLLLVGHAGGFNEPLGITGQCPSLASGVYAARQIVTGDRALERFARQFRVYRQRLWRIRRTVNAWTDHEMNLVVRAARLGGSLMSNSPFNMLNPAGWLVDALRLPDDPSPEVGPQ